MKAIEVVAGIIWNQAANAILLSKRLKNQHQGGLWEFPGGKIESGETAEQALQRELMEELTISVENIHFFHQEKHNYPDKTVAIQFYHCTHSSGEIIAQQGQEWRWFAVKELVQLDFPAANRQVVEKLAEL